MNFKKLLIRLLTQLLPLRPMRAVYRWYSYTRSQLKYGDWKFPRIITIEISSHCNRTCSYCPNVVHPQTARLIKDDVMQKIAQRLGEIKYGGVVDFIFFNEPTLHPKLADYVALVKKHAPAAIPRISTNGDLLTEAKVEKLVGAGLDRIYAMRHNPTPDGWQERISFLDKKFPGIFTLMDIDEVEATTGLHDFGGLVEVKKHRGRTVIDGKARCQVHRHIAQIGIDGAWLLCCVDYERSMNFGSLLDRSIIDIWRDPRFVKARAALEAGKPISKTCTTCTCLIERGDFKRPDFVPRPIAV